MRPRGEARRPSGDFLHHRVLSRDDPKAVALHEILIQAYDDAYAAFGLAGQVGLMKADIEVYPKLRFTWWSILEEVVKEGQLLRLVDEALHDQTIAKWHGRIREVIEVPEGALLPASDQVDTPTTESERRDAALRPSIGSIAKLWKPGTTLGVRFLNGSPALQGSVEAAAMQWIEYANLKFEFGHDPDVPIRVSFDQPGNWAYVGTDALSAAPGQPTANFGRITDDSPRREIEGVVLHEFGHVIGLMHEHGNPASTIAWNREKVYEVLSGPPSYWSRAAIDHNIFSVWPPAYFPVHKVFDPHSIMMIPQPAEFLAKGRAIGWNTKLSPVDKQFVAALYRLDRSP